MKQRRDNRHKVLIRARLRGAGALLECCILDLSTRGLLATASEVPPRGEVVELQADAPRGRVTLVGRVEWAKGRRFGLTLDERLDLGLLLAGEKAPVHAAVAVAAPARMAGRRFEFWVIAAAALVAGLLLVRVVSGGWGWAATAREAMAQANAGVSAA